MLSASSGRHKCIDTHIDNVRHHPKRLQHGQSTENIFQHYRSNRVPLIVGFLSDMGDLFSIRCLQDRRPEKAKASGQASPAEAASARYSAACFTAHGPVPEIYAVRTQNVNKNKSANFTRSLEMTHSFLQAGLWESKLEYNGKPG